MLMWVRAWLVFGWLCLLPCPGRNWAWVGLVPSDCLSFPEMVFGKGFVCPLATSNFMLSSLISALGNKIVLKVSQIKLR